MADQSQAQLALIIGPDPAPFETLISQLMSTQNEQRSQAETLFNLSKQNHPDSLALKLVQNLQSCSQVEIRAMAAILLRKQITRDDSYIWPRLSDSTQSALKAHLLACVQREEEKTIVKKLCDTVAELASSIIQDGQWPELLPFMFQCVSSDSTRLQESALLMFAQLSQFIGETLIPFLSTLHAVFHQCLGSNSPRDVRIAALAATINFIQSIETPADRERFQDLLSPMMQTLTGELNRGQEAMAQEALDMFIELAGSEPKFLGRQLADIVDSMLQIAEADQLEEGTRHLAIEFLITLTEAREMVPGKMGKLPQYIGRLFTVLMKMLLDIEDVPAWHNAENEDEDAGESSNYSVGQECLDRLSIALGWNTIVPVAFELLPVYLAALEWQKRHAALITLAQIAEGCSKVVIKNLEQVVTMVLNSIQDPHPRVRWAAINAIGQLSMDLGPDLQIQYHPRVVPALASITDAFQIPWLQVEIKNLEQVLTMVLNSFQDLHPRVRWEAINVIGQCSMDLGPYWQIQYHPHVVPAFASAMDDFQNPRVQVMIKNLEQVVTMVLNSFQDPHPLVRCAAISAIGQLFTDLGPDWHIRYYHRVVPALASAMDDFQNPRVQALAASAVLNFSENCTPDILTPYLDGIVSELLVLLLNGRQGALTALASVADSSQELFQKYYDAVMPYLKAILINATDKSNCMLRGKAKECISLVGMAVGKEKFRDDENLFYFLMVNVLYFILRFQKPTLWIGSWKVMEVLMTLQGSQMEADDRTLIYMLQAWARLYKCLGQDFLPYKSVVMPPLVQSTQLKPDDTITSADSDDDIDGSDDESIETITLGDERIGIMTSVLEEKDTACTMLCFYAIVLDEGFYPWIDLVALTLVPLLKFYFHEVRKAAVSAMPDLLRSAKLAVEKGQAQGRDESYVKQLSDYIIPALDEALHKEPETTICASMLDALNECIQISGPLIGQG